VSETEGANAAGGSDSADGELVRRARAGEIGAFDELVRRYQRRAVGRAWRLLNNRDDALEVVQDAFLRAYDRLDALKRPGRFGAWLLRIVSNLALNRRRARALRKASSLDAPGDGIERAEVTLPDPRAQSGLSAAYTDDLKRLIAEAIGTLPEMQRLALVLFSIEKMPQKEVARMLGCSVEAVKWHVFSARKKLKERLKDYL